MQKLEQGNLSQIYRMSEEVDLETRQIYLIGGGDGNAEVRNKRIYYQNIFGSDRSPRCGNLGSLSVCVCVGVLY